MAPEAFIDGLAARHYMLCRDDAVYIPFGTSTVDGHLAYTAVVGCAVDPTKPTQGEVSYFMAVRGNKDIYVFQRGIRSSKFDPEKPPINFENAETFLEGFGPIGFCDWPAEQVGQCKKTRAPTALRAP